MFVIPSVLTADQRGASALIMEARVKNLAKRPEWLRLLHYHRNVWNLHRSAVDDPLFFLSRRGPKDPAAELEATIRSFFEPAADPNDSTACRFPARTAWLESELGFSAEPQEKECDRFQGWKDKMAPKGVYLVFASYYFNNPASMYGHTFLKLERAGYEDGGGLLDYTVNYAAVTNTSNGLMFAVKGLTGGYKGRFSTEPYYMKIQKYNNIESRDLWEYKLTLSSDERDQLTRHIWELGPAAIDYYFFNKNCSYQLLPLLEAVRPSLDLSSRFRFRAIPLDTLRRVLSIPGFVEKPYLRPSHARLMMARRSLLSEAEAQLAKDLGSGRFESGEPALKAVPAERQALVLDTAYDYFRYKVGFLRNQTPMAQERERRLLLLRKESSSSSIKVPIGSPDPPEIAHGTGQFSVLAGADRKTGFEEIGIRAALHDQESDSTGFVPGSQLEMVHVRGRYYNDPGKLRLEKMTFVDVFSLSAWDPWVHPPSWRVWAGLDVARDMSPDARAALNGGVKGGSGFSFQHAPTGSLWYVLWRSEGMVGDIFDDGYRVGAGGESGVIVSIRRRLRFHAAANALRFPIGHVGNLVRFSGTASVSLAKNFELRLIGERQNGAREIRGGAFIYW